MNTISIRKKFSISASELPLVDEYEPPPGNSSLSLSPPDLSTLFHLRPPSTRQVFFYTNYLQLGYFLDSLGAITFEIDHGLWIDSL